MLQLDEDVEGSLTFPITISSESSYTLPVGGMVRVTCSQDDERSYTSTETARVIIANLSSDDWEFTSTSSTVGNISNQQIEISQKITTSSTVNNNLTYTLRENEYIQIAFPNYYSTRVYPAYVYYRFFNTATNDESNEVVARANTEYTLGSGEQLVMLYTKDEVQRTDVYGPGTIIRPSFNIFYTSKASNSKSMKTWNYDGISERTDAFIALGAGQQIEIREILETVLNGANVPCY